MKGTKLLRLLLLSSFVLVGCDNPFIKKDQPKVEDDQTQQQIPGEGGENPQDPPEPEDTHFKTKVTVKMEALLKGDNSVYSIEYDYSDSYFLKDAEEYDKDLSLLSFGAALSAAYLSYVQKFFQDTQFNNIKTHDLDIDPTEETLGYTLAHKTIDDSELFAVAIRGNQYKQEWQNNFIIGEEGDHNGFLERAEELFSDLTSYVAQYKGNKTVKLWIVGYSRAGAISNLLASLIFRSDGFSVNPKNMYIYTFEAPASLIEEHALKYKNVHNIVNSADLITYIPPTQYGLYRGGTEFEIYDASVSSLIKEFDPSLTIPAYIRCNPSGQVLANDIEFVQYLVSSVFDYNTNPSKSASTREQYVENYQTGLSYSIGLMFSLSPLTRSAMMNALTGDYSTALLIMTDSSGQSMANFIKTYLELDEIEYDNDQLVAASASLVGAMTTIFSGFLSVYTSDYKTNMTRTLDMHYPEVTYCLLNNAHSKLEA